MTNWVLMEKKDLLESSSPYVGFAIKVVIQSQARHGSDLFNWFGLQKLRLLFYNSVFYLYCVLHDS